MGVGFDRSGHMRCRLQHRSRTVCAVAGESLCLHCERRRAASLHLWGECRTSQVCARRKQAAYGSAVCATPSATRVYTATGPGVARQSSMPTRPTPHPALLPRCAHPSSLQSVSSFPHAASSARTAAPSAPISIIASAAAPSTAAMSVRSTRAMPSAMSPSRSAPSSWLSAAQMR